MPLLAAIPILGSTLATVGSAVGAGAAVTTAGAVSASAATAGALVVGTAAAGGIAAYGAYQQAIAQKNMLNYQAQAASVQAQATKNVGTSNITAVQDQASRDSTILGRQQAAVRGAQAASAGAQGLDGSVTGADIAKDTFTKQQMDQMTLQYNANVKSWDITNRTNNQLWGLGVQQDQYSQGANNAETAGNIAVAGSLFNTASQIGTESIYANK